MELFIGQQQRKLDIYSTISAVAFQVAVPLISADKPCEHLIVKPPFVTVTTVIPRYGLLQVIITVGTVLKVSGNVIV